MWAAQGLKIERTMSFFISPGGLGTMGYGIPKPGLSSSGSFLGARLQLLPVMVVFRWACRKVWNSCLEEELPLKIIGF